MIRSARDIASAYTAGRVHSQRFVKNAGTTGDGHWHDWAYASGQPAYDARIGAALEFTPYAAQGNDAIYFPAIPAEMERRLASVAVVFTPNGTTTTAVSFEMYDLLGVYPLIDGDSTDVQSMGNAAPIPRYPTGEGVRAVLVNHISPVLAAADMSVDYVNSAGATRTVTWRAALFGQNKVSYSVAGAGTSGPLYCALAQGDAGVAQITSVQFTTAPGGLWAIYLVKPIARLQNRTANGISAPSDVSETLFTLAAGGHLPLIKDGAALGFFFMPATGARTTALYGHADFIWG